MNKKVYLIPFSEDNLENKIFLPYKVSSANVPPFGYLKRYLKDKGYSLNTIDFWDLEVIDNSDVLIVFDHPPIGIYKFFYRFRKSFQGSYFTLKNDRLNWFLSKFPKRLLFQWESPVNMPWMYKYPAKLQVLYDQVYSIPAVKGAKHFYYPQIFNSWNKRCFDLPHSKFLVMMNGRHQAKGYFGTELYSERVRAAEFFAGYNELDLYGQGWDHHPSKTIRKVAKGFVNNKPNTMAQYKFALCFENAIWPGYVTEKIFDCLAVGTIPIYLGAPDIAEDVPRECFIDQRNFESYSQLREFLHSLTKNQIENYRQAIRTYFNSEKFRRFTKENFAETIFKAISE